jgi:hypothetical protein
MLSSASQLLLRSSIGVLRHAKLGVVKRVKYLQLATAASQFIAKEFQTRRSLCKVRNTLEFALLRERQWLVGPGLPN